MDIRRLFESSPPAEPLTSLAALLRDWQRRTAPGGGLDVRRDAVVEWCREAETFRASVYRACGSRDRNGKMHNHQSKVRETARTELADKICAEKAYVRRIDSFDELHDFIDGAKPWGIGPVTVYDVAVRVGAFLKLEPESLYLHAGVRAGWIALLPLEPFGFARRWAGIERLRPESWPEELRVLKADDLEDFLCTYRTIFPDVREAGWRAEWEK